MRKKDNSKEKRGKAVEQKRYGTFLTGAACGGMVCTFQLSSHVRACDCI